MLLRSESLEEKVVADQNKYLTPLPTIEQSINESDTDITEKSPQLSNKRQQQSRPDSVLHDGQINLDLTQTRSDSSDSIKSKQSKHDSPVSYHLEDLTSIDGGLVNLSFLTNKAGERNAHVNKSFDDEL